MRQASLDMGVLQLAIISLSVLASHSTHLQTHLRDLPDNQHGRSNKK